MSLAEIHPSEIQGLTRPLWIDVRTAAEREEEAIKDSHFLPLHFWADSSIELKLKEILGETNRPIVIYCAHGVRSLHALQILGSLFPHLEAYSLQGGIVAYEGSGFEVLPGSQCDAQAEKPLSPTRYDRQLLMEDFGVEGQGLLHSSRVLMVGMGGLGSPAAMYLSAIGVGHLGIVDEDKVELSNLSRQVLYSPQDCGVSKVDVAHRKLHELNPLTQFELFPVALDSHNIEQIIENYDVVIDGVDSFETKLLLNDTCHRLQKPWIFGSVEQWEGQAALFAPDSKTCLRCLYPSPPVGLKSCSQIGVVGTVPGLIGMLQANLAVHVLTQKEKTQLTTLYRWNAKLLKFHSFQIHSNSDCTLQHQ